MSLYEKLKIKIKTLQQILETKKRKCISSLKEVKYLCKKFSFAIGVLNAEWLG